MDKILYVYNQFYYSFADDVLESHGNNATDEVKEKITRTLDARTKHSPTSTRNIDRFLKSIGNDTFKELAAPIPDDVKSVMGADSVAKLSLLKGLSVKDLIDTMTTDITTLASYVYVFALLAYVYMDCDSDDDDDSASDTSGEDQVDSTAGKIERILHALKTIQNGEQDAIEPVNDELADGLIANISKVMKPSAIPSNASDDATESLLQNTKIGSLAKEISEEIDLSSLKIEKPEDLLNMGQNGMLGDIISKVGSKIHQKMDKGELKHEDLMSEAMSMLSMLGGGKAGAASGGMGGLAGMMNNPMFKDIMKNMGGSDMGALGGLVGQMANMAKKTDKGKSAHVRDRLRHKLDERNKTKKSE